MNQEINDGEIIGIIILAVTVAIMAYWVLKRMRIFKWNALLAVYTSAFVTLLSMKCAGYKAVEPLFYYIAVGAGVIVIMAILKLLVDEWVGDEKPREDRRYPEGARKD